MKFDGYDDQLDILKDLNKLQMLLFGPFLVRTPHISALIMGDRDKSIIEDYKLWSLDMTTTIFGHLHFCDIFCSTQAGTNESHANRTVQNNICLNLNINKGEKDEVSNCPD